jgi:hypothetical protein
MPRVRIDPGTDIRKSLQKAHFEVNKNMPVAVMSSGENMSEMRRNTFGTCRPKSFPTFHLPAFLRAS